MKAVVIPDRNEITVQEVELAPPKARELKVKMAAVGVCHSDLSVINGTIPTPTPLVVGHEGAGVVEEVGEGVTKVAPGDHVVLSFVPFCGDCYFCKRSQPYLCEKANTLNMARQLDGTSRVTLNGTEIGVMCGLGCMAPYAVVPDISVVKIEKSIPLRVAALVGCGVTTGVGAALNTADVQPGSSVAVFGCGGVGISAIQGARVAGATTIIAVDKDPAKLDMAKTFGATDGLVADEGVVKAIRKLTDGKGVDYAFEAIGIGAVMELASSATRAGGKTVLVGIGKRQDQMAVNAFSYPLQSKTLCGCMYGSANPPEDFPRMLRLYQDGKLDLDNMITKTYTIDEAPQAFEDLEQGKNARGVIVFD
jgi:S-(hydroxymethyl)glutathione dehydrogenase / alcohol dehydrogenase